MKRSSKVKVESLKSESGVALLWDESFLWGLMTYKALESAGLPFDLIRSGEIQAGRLDDYRVLFVPGGWASNKLKSLGDDGIDAIKRFVGDGGAYLGFCGGAGLATLDGIGLLNVRRKPTKARVPSFSGRITLALSESPLWCGIAGPVFQAWWPSQFVVEDVGIRVLAAYGEALPDSFSSDMNVGDTERHGSWSALEDAYGINLDPGRLLHEPAVLEGRYGEGRVILSLVHFDTPCDRDGAVVLRNLWEYCGVRNVERVPVKERQGAGKRLAEDDTSRLVSELFGLCDALISLGIRNFLWFWRNPMLLQWRRGVRGLEYCTLYGMMKEIERIMKTGKALPAPNGGAGAGPSLPVRERVTRIRETLVPFVEKAGRLLMLERRAMHNGYITYENCDDPEIREIRAELFSNSKSHGGLFKTVIDEIDALLYSLLRA